MFTGIVEETGTVRQISVTPDGARLTIEAVIALGGTRVGDSIAMNGACLTVVTRDDRTFAVEATLETLRRTNLGELGIGDRLHLERALAVGGRFGGHFMQGHVDGTGTIRDRQTEGDAVVQSFSAPPEIVRYLVPKGSISVDGVSLTVVNVGADWFDVWLIPHTLDVTLLTQKPVGATVNLEADILAKYVARAVEASLPVPIAGSA
ncbi:MAG: riboflavin synthase [Chloroflexi bacterium]|nr:MAG: riboflavin synthase [Chloroflexota bacterium]